MQNPGKTIDIPARVIGFCLALIFLCSCATQDSIRPPLPADALINKGAGNDRLFVTLRLESGEKLLFAVDTGMPFTVLDKSLESRLGKRLGTSKADYSWFGKVTVGVYSAPKLYLGDAQLLVNDRILTDNLSKLSSSGQPVMGILGMDCLRHYCIQLDFDAGKMCFLDPDHLKTNDLGKAFPITISDGEVLTRSDLFGLKIAQLSVDTGCTTDAALKTKFFEQELQRQTAVETNEYKTAAGVPVRVAYFEKVVFNDNVYHQFILSDCPDDNYLGLRFMARHLATFNFPKRIMYLRRNMELLPVADDLAIEAQIFLSNLKEKGQLPGWLQDEHGNMSIWIPGENNPEVYPVSRTINAAKNGGVSKYHYIVMKAFKDGAWKLQRAWRTDTNEHVAEEYPVP